MKKYIMLATVVLLCGLLSACKALNVSSEPPAQSTGSTNKTESGVSSGAGATSSAGSVDFAQDASEMFTDRDMNSDYEASDCVQITLNGDSVVASSDAVHVSGSTVTITEEAVYVLSGMLNNGSIIVNADDKAKVQLVFNGVSVHSEKSAPLIVLTGNKVFLTLAEGTENTLSNGGAFVALEENNIDGVIFAKQDLTINGTGALTIQSPAGHGIVVKDDLVITGGRYTIQAASHGMDANNSIRVANAAFTIEAGKDGLHAEHSEDTTLGFVYVSSGSMTVHAAGDGLSAGAHIQIENGVFDLTTGGGSENGPQHSGDNWGGPMGMGGGQPRETTTVLTETTDNTSTKGIKATSGLFISNGSFTVNSADDAVHANGTITIHGGTFQIATGDDAFHADDTLTITAGTVNVTESYEGLEGLHIEVAGGNIHLVSSDDGLNAAGGTDSSGFGGMGNDQFGPGGKRPGAPGGFGGMGSSSSDGSIVISGGDLYVQASGDGLDANGTLLISGGNTVVCGPTKGDTATLDYDVSATITGGTFIGTGASGMAQTFSDWEQGVIAGSLNTQAAGTKITLKDEKGNEIISYEPQLSFAVVILSSPNIVSGNTYTISIGSFSTEVEAY